MNKREKLFLSVLALVVIVFLYYFFVMQYQLDKIDDIDSQIAVKDSEINVYKLSKNSLKTLNESKTKMEEDFEAFYSPFLRNIEQEEIILLINEILVRSEVNVSSFNFQDFQSGDYLALDYDQLIATINIDGSYEDVMSLVSSFWRFDHNIYIESLILSAEEDLLTGSIDVAFIRVNNEYASNTSLFQWYNDVYYLKENPFSQEDFSYLFNPNYFYTGTDVEFYNEPFEEFSDIIGHWGEEVINFFGRNGYILGDDENNVYPDEPMTRLDTVLLLDLVFRWELQQDFIELESFSDYDIIADLTDLEKKALLKAYNSGYIFGYEDNTLRPYSNITYEELGYLGDNLVGESDITWNDVAIKIRDLFGYESIGFNEPTAPATRAEIIYFLSYINDNLRD
ncbi:MAG: S-layer homology domain-containing protein [Clostridiales bacterium]|nr:S-layer homology domain-containing protein [Clostridiales bacterium]